MIATWESLGTTSLSSSIRFPLSSGPAKWLSPVTFPPGRARLATSPILTGSTTATMMIGIVVVAFLRSEEHTSELQSRSDLVCRLLLEKKKDRDGGHHPAQARVGGHAAQE